MGLRLIGFPDLDLRIDDDDLVLLLVQLDPGASNELEAVDPNQKPDSPNLYGHVRNPFPLLRHEAVDGRIIPHVKDNPQVRVPEPFGPIAAFEPLDGLVADAEYRFPAFWDVHSTSVSERTDHPYRVAGKP
jgi:hypothetical protein